MLSTCGQAGMNVVQLQEGQISQEPGRISLVFCCMQAPNVSTSNWLEPPMHAKHLTVLTRPLQVYK